MRVLLINPNRLRTPPVPPIGLEYLAASLEKGGHAVSILDLCFVDEPYAEINRSVAEFRPDIAGVTVTNIDSISYHDNEFYLDAVRGIVLYLKSSFSLKVIIGGAAMPAGPEGLLRYLNADYGISGPGEGVINKLLSDIQGAGEKIRNIYNGRFPAYSNCSRIISHIDYRRYYEAEGIAGFETHKGCSSSCVYCIEANSPVAFRRPEDVVQEIRGFTERGHNKFHLCDAEFNEDLDHSLEFCSALRKANLGIQWAVYMKPSNYNQKLFRLMRETGVYQITLAIDSFRKCPLYWTDTERIIFNARSNGIRIVVDFLTGFPYEDEELLKWCLDFFRRLAPDRVNINTFIRLYRSRPISGIIMQNADLRQHLLGNIADESMIMPVFYSHIEFERLMSLIAQDSLFRIQPDFHG
jgi:radical SAM superfamily enzyme YgiQ (UPF0313 family)